MWPDKQLFVHLLDWEPQLNICMTPLSASKVPVWLVLVRSCFSPPSKEGRLQSTQPAKCKNYKCIQTKFDLLCVSPGTVRVPKHWGTDTIPPCKDIQSSTGKNQSQQQQQWPLALARRVMHAVIKQDFTMWKKKKFLHTLQVARCV